MFRSLKQALVAIGVAIAAPSVASAGETYNFFGTSGCPGTVGHDGVGLMLRVTSISPNLTCFQDGCRWDFKVNMGTYFDHTGYCTHEGAIGFDLSYQVIERQPVPTEASAITDVDGTVSLSLVYETKQVEPTVLTIGMEHGPRFTWTCTPIGTAARCISSRERFPTLFHNDSEFEDGVHNYATISVVTERPGDFEGTGFAACVRPTDSPTGLYAVRPYGTQDDPAHPITCTSVMFPPLPEVSMPDYAGDNSTFTLEVDPRMVRSLDQLGDPANIIIAPFDPEAADD